ncbi:hypothetical protein DNTS_032522 [Danionella cerebrum]|uniref:mTERF domain-containing protein 1, mitochondrial n=1 Tax=Danionella cerebrum TaxID=2873325 RepID=A0A553Q011_9TELE|nr:hypothetical protein DNTS_032522 [Danionella translucida]TRY83268.1 hypothetical protein DNTS_032522 [Danionella translucida]
MHLCQRCVRLLPWRPVSAVLQDSVHTLHQLSFLQKLSRQSVISRRLVGRQESVRFYSDHQMVSSDLHVTDPELKNAGKPIVSLKHLDTNPESIPDFFSDSPEFDLDAPFPCSALEEISDEEAIRIHVPLTLPPESSTLAPYVDKSETFKKLIQLGVNLWELEKRPNVGSMLLRLDFDTDIMPKLMFLKDLGVEENSLGPLISKNPFILTLSLENLQTRASYLKSKFREKSVSDMTLNILIRLPKMLCGSLEPIKENLKVFEFEFGFRGNEIQHIVCVVPKVLIANKIKLAKIFNFVHNTMNVPHALIVKFPQVFNSKFLRISERHMFLEYLGRAQYNPSQPGFISLDRLVSLPDEVFCSELAQATLEDFERFQKTL